MNDCCTRFMPEIRRAQIRRLDVFVLSSRHISAPCHVHVLPHLLDKVQRADTTVTRSIASLDICASTMSICCRPGLGVEFIRLAMAMHLQVGNSSLMDLTATEEACCSATVQAVVSGDQARGSLSLRGDVGVSPDLLLVRSSGLHPPSPSPRGGPDTCARHFVLEAMIKFPMSHAFTETCL